MFKNRIFEHPVVYCMEVYYRSKALNALLILSFAGSGVGLILYLAAALFHTNAIHILTEFSSVYQTESYSQLYFALLALLQGVSLTGVYIMWRRQRNGFFLYAVAQTLLLLLPLIWLGKPAFSSVSLITTLLFLLAYALLFRRSFNA